MSALFSGLTLGLMGLDVFVLKRKIRLGDSQAKKVYKVRKNGNLLLTTLLLGNVAVNSALAIFLGTVASGVVAGLIATGLIFLFGEIIPQAIISRYALAFGARTAWLVRILIFLLFPITAPIAWILDKVLGKELQTVFSRNELLSVIEEHEASDQSDLDEDEERIVKGALSFSGKTVGEVMTPMNVAESLNISDKITAALLHKLRESGHSRFPIFNEERNDVIGILYLKELVGRSTVGKTIKDVYQKHVIFVEESSHLDDVLNAFLSSRNHLFVVIDNLGGIEGLISVEDVIEEIVGREIMDESDKVADLRKLARKSKAKKHIVGGPKKLEKKRKTR
jgi:metal transporter CNNM